MKRILITGLTGNLGTAAAEYFHASNWGVDGISRYSPISDTGKIVGETVVLSSTYPVNLSDWHDTEHYVNCIEAGWDIVLIAHGVQEKVLIHEINSANYDHIVENNMKSAVILSSSLVRLGKLNPGALVVFCSSIQATQPRAGRALYAMAKGGLESWMRAMAVELAPDARAMALRLGQMKGQMKGITFPDEERKKIAERTPLPWVGFKDTARLVMALYEQPAFSGEVVEVSSMHKFSIWPE